jgi:hypothetical protein
MPHARSRVVRATGTRPIYSQVFLFPQKAGPISPQGAFRHIWCQVESRNSTLGNGANSNARGHMPELQSKRRGTSEESCADFWKPCSENVQGILACPATNGVILRNLRCPILFAAEILDVKRLLPRLLLLNPSTIKPKDSFDPKLQCPVRHQGPEHTPIEIPHLRFLLV